MNNIFIIGLPGCGKTSISKMLAKKINLGVYDLDEIIEERENKNITEIFNIYGEEYFRNIETKVLKEISLKNKCIISTGGGIILKKENRDIIKKNGISIFIDRDVDSILNNINTENRPLLKNKSKLIELHNQRYKLYKESADIIFKSNIWYSSIESAFEHIYKYLQNNNKFISIT